ncbi:histone deacetylase [Candidatus Omnitrophota bacterium]
MKTAVLYHSQLEKYSFGEGHPFGGERFRNFFNFFESRFFPFKSQLKLINPNPASDQNLRLVHSQDYISAIQAASAGTVLADITKYVSPDNLNPLTGYMPLGIEEGAKIITGISLCSGELVAENKFDRAIGIGGGMHHAKPEFGEGFCFYNDIAVCARNLKQKYKLRRILVLDTDAHAGNGTMEIFYDDPEVLFIDIHQDPRTIYPGTGFISEIGSNKGEGFTINLPVWPGTGNQAYRFIFEEIIFPLAREFAPQAIIRYGGSDPHYLDTLTNLGLTLEGFRMIGRQVHDIANELTVGRSIDLLLSGYNLMVLPFAWAALIAGLLDLDVDLNGLKEAHPPSGDNRLSETKDMTRQLRSYLKKHWKCMSGG